MRLGLSIIFVAACGALAAAQVTSPPPVCFAFNAATVSSPPLTLFYPPQAGGLTVHFVAPSSALVERADLPVSLSNWLTPALIIELYQTSALGVPPGGPPIATFAPGAYVMLSLWQSFLPPAPIQITAGLSYAVRILSTPPPTGGDCWGIYFDPTGAQQLPYQFVATPACPGPLSGVFPPTGLFGLMLVFRGLGCGPGPLASATQVGTGCGENPALPWSFAAYLQPQTPPAIGSTFLVSVASPAVSTTAWLFGSIGVNPAGAPIFPGSSCLHYLDQASLAALFLAGAEPIIVAPLTQGYGLWQFQVPFAPAMVGTVLGIQAMVTGAAGTIPLGGAAFGQTTNALQLLVGY